MLDLSAGTLRELALIEPAFSDRDLERSAANFLTGWTEMLSHRRERSSKSGLKRSQDFVRIASKTVSRNLRTISPSITCRDNRRRENYLHQYSPDERASLNLENCFDAGCSDLTVKSSGKGFSLRVCEQVSAVRTCPGFHQA